MNVPYSHLISPSCFLSQKKQYLPKTVGQLTVDVSLSTGFLQFTDGFALSIPFLQTPRTLHIAHKSSIIAPLICLLPKAHQVAESSFDRNESKRLFWFYKACHKLVKVRSARNKMKLKDKNMVKGQAIRREGGQGRKNRSTSLFYVSTAIFYISDRNRSIPYPHIFIDLDFGESGAYP